MRTEMPAVAAFIDGMREAFGREGIDQAIRAGMRGRPTFWAREGGREIGTPIAAGDYLPAFGPDRYERTPAGQAAIEAERRKGKR